MTEQAIRSVAVMVALSYLRTPYHWSTWDCSRYAQTVWERAGIDVESIIAEGAKTSATQRRSDCIFRGLPEPPAGYVAQPGDLSFYGDAATGARHVVVVLGIGGNAIIGANGGGPPLPAEKEEAYAARMNRAAAGVRIEDWRKGGLGYRGDLLGIRAMPVSTSTLAQKP